MRTVRTEGIWLVTLCLALSACGPGTIDGSIPRTRWMLRANADQGLVDTDHKEFRAYPNPRLLQSMTVELREDARLCADDGKRTWCGGPVQGIPYMAALSVQQDMHCVKVVDIYGHTVLSFCREGPISEAVYAMMRTDELGPNAGVLAQGDLEHGAQLVADSVNAGLLKIGLKTRIKTPTANDLTDFRQGDIPLGEGTCKDVAEYLDSEFSDDHPGTSDYVFGSSAISQCLKYGKCRIGQLVTRSMAEACASLPPDLKQSASAQNGIIGAGGNAVGQLCDEKSGEITSCVGSPLVLDLKGDGLQLKGADGTANFALLGNAPLKVGWLAGSDDALLAIDLDGDGRITSGRELFGDAAGGWAPNGFAALARLDENGDGVISADDASFGRLLAWLDDGDGISQSHELVPLATLGIRSISLRFSQSDEVDRFGNQLGLRGSAMTRTGRAVPVVDVLFRMVAPDPASPSPRSTPDLASPRSPSPSLGSTPDF